MDTNEKHWAKWNWRTDGDVMVNGAFFVPSGDGVSLAYARATSLQAKAAGFIDQLTVNAGVFGDPRYYMIFFLLYCSIYPNKHLSYYCFASILY